MFDPLAQRLPALVRLLLPPLPTGLRAPGAGATPGTVAGADSVELRGATPDELVELLRASLQDPRASRRVAALALLDHVAHLPRTRTVLPLVEELARSGSPEERSEAAAWLRRLGSEGGEGAPFSGTRSVAVGDAAPMGGRTASHDLRTPPPGDPPAGRAWRGGWPEALAVSEWVRRLAPRPGRRAGWAALALLLLWLLLSPG